jgi:hypothetical protein
MMTTIASPPVRYVRIRDSNHANADLVSDKDLNHEDGIQYDRDRHDWTTPFSVISYCSYLYHAGLGQGPNVQLSIIVL